MVSLFKHIVFDLDGTLIDSKDDLANAVNAALEALGLERQEPGRLYPHIGRGARVLVEKALGPQQLSRIDQAVEVFLAYYRVHLLDHTLPYPGIVELLHTLARNSVDLTLLTNKPAALTESILTGLGIKTSFAAVVAGDTLTTRKPDPAGAFDLCQQVSRKRRESLIVGDSEVDILAAKAAGIASCGVTWGFAGNRVSTLKPDYLINSPAELLELILSDPAGLDP